MKNRDKLYRFGLKPMNRLLFYGDSGCGKTFLGKALSNHLGYKMLYVDIARALSQGNVAMNLTNVFKIANSGGNYLVFLDECDSIAWNRDAKDAESGNVRRATNSLFQLMDQMSPDVIVICATNMLHRLDPAFARRFNMKMEFKRPEMNVKEVIQKFLRPEFTLIFDKDDPITERRTKMSYYELQDVAERMMKKAVLNNSTRIKMSDIYLDIARQMNIKTSLRVELEG
jgi:AAA+ superfamily predicted ATPase